jgi:hypothetical protein
MSDAWVIVLLYFAVMAIAIVIGIAVQSYLELERRRRAEQQLSTIRPILRAPFDEPSTQGK